MFPVKFCFDSVADIFQISLYCSNNFFQKLIHLVLSKSFLYTLIFGGNMHEGLFF